VAGAASRTKKVKMTQDAVKWLSGGKGRQGCITWCPGRADVTRECRDDLRDHDGCAGERTG
jgi:hypothetical protein